MVAVRSGLRSPKGGVTSPSEIIYEDAFAMTKNLFLTLTLFAMTACAASDHAVENASPHEDFHHDQRPMAQTLVYECQDMEFVARVGPEEMALWVEGRYLALSQARSASGVKYVEGDVVFWQHGDESMLQLNERHYKGCTLNQSRAPWEDARRRNVDFRGVGNEPGWQLEYRKGQNCLFETDYGATRALLSNPLEVEGKDGRTITAESESGALRVTILDDECTDTMQGAHYPSSVQIEYQGKFYYGCGQDLDHPWE